MAKITKQQTSSQPAPVQKTDAQLVQEAVAAGRVKKVLPPANAQTQATKKKSAVPVQSSKPAPIAKPKPQATKKEEQEKKARLAALAAQREERREQEKEERAAARATAEATWETITTTVPCACGCGDTVQIRRFKPGHDAKLFSRLLHGESLPSAAFLALATSKPKSRVA